MKNTSYTPGPWLIREQGEANEYLILTPEKKWVLAAKINGEQTAERQRANMALIAASPEMLEMLEELNEIIAITNAPIKQELSNLIKKIKHAQ